MDPRPYTYETQTTTELPAVDGRATAEPAPLSVAVVAAETCASCGVQMAGDQRYCVECGQPRGAPRLPLADGLQPRLGDARPLARPSAFSRASANTTLIAGIGTLLLAVGVGVLIGRSGNAPVAKAGPSTVTVVSSGSGPGATAAAPGAAATATPSAAAKAAAKGKKATATTKAIPTPPKSKAPAAPVVKVGSPGKGPGYQNGKFTGNFF